jgi:hypothetical protein
MSAGFAVDESFTFAGCSCADWGAAVTREGAGCAVCAWAANDEDSRGLRRVAATANKTQVTVAIVRIDERRKNSSQTYPDWNLSRAYLV